MSPRTAPRVWKWSQLMGGTQAVPGPVVIGLHTVQQSQGLPAGISRTPFQIFFLSLCSLLFELLVFCSVSHLCFAERASWFLYICDRRISQFVVFVEVVFEASWHAAGYYTYVVRVPFYHGFHFSVSRSLLCHFWD